MSKENKNLYYLHELPDYKVAEDYADVRGWEVYDAGNTLVGRVDGLLVNKHAERVVYLDVEVDEAIVGEGVNTFEVPASDGVHGFLNKEGENHIIIPIGLAHLNEDEKKVICREINSETFRTTRRFSRNTDITREYEQTVFNNYVPDAKTHAGREDDEFYKRREFR